MLKQGTSPNTAHVLHAQFPFHPVAQLPDVSGCDDCYALKRPLMLRIRHCRYSSGLVGGSRTARKPTNNMSFDFLQLFHNRGTSDVRKKKKNIGKAHGLRAAFWPVKHYIYIHLTSAARPYQSPVCFWAAKSMDLPDSNSIVSDDTSTNCFMKLLDLHQVSKIKVMGWCFIGMFPGLPGDHQNHPEYSRIIICCTYNIYIYIYIEIILVLNPMVLGITHIKKFKKTICWHQFSLPKYDNMMRYNWYHVHDYWWLRLCH